MIRTFRWAVAIVLIATGTALLFLPGPGIPLIALGAALLTPDLLRWGRHAARRLAAV